MGNLSIYYKSLTWMFLPIFGYSRIPKNNHYLLGWPTGAWGRYELPRNHPFRLDFLTHNPPWLAWKPEGWPAFSLGSPGSCAKRNGHTCIDLLGFFCWVPNQTSELLQHVVLRHLTEGSVQHRFPITFVLSAHTDLKELQSYQSSGQRLPVLRDSNENRTVHHLKGKWHSS